MTPPLAVHIIPYDGIGGVEVAARTVPDGAHSGFQFAKLYLTFKDPWGRPEGMGRSENNPLVYVSAVRKLLAARPEVVIASLWRSCVVLIVLKLLRPRTRCVTFLHSAVDMHFIDRWVTRLAVLLSSEVWADSRATLDGRMPGWLSQPTRVISFLTERREPPKLTAAGPRFIFWGRLHWQKDLPRAVRLFAKIQQQHPSATFDIIGPDDGALPDIQLEINRTGVKGVRLLGPMSHDEIFQHAAKCSFYLQTSAEEGAAMSVIEAMQHGLIPVVTPVGDIGSYCFDGENAIVIKQDESAVERVSALLDHFHSFSSASANAYRTWSDRPLYRDSLMAACRQLTATHTQ